MRSNIVLVEESKGKWFASSLEYKNVYSQGNSIEEARENIGLVMGDMIMNKEAIPNGQTIEPDEYVKNLYKKEKFNKWILSDINIADYLEIENASVSVRTNVSIKKGYKLVAKLRKLNISDFVNKALAKELGVEF